MQILFRIIILLALPPNFQGCAGLASAPDKVKLANFNRAYIVHLQDPPLGVDPTFKYVIPGAAGSLGAVQATGIFNTISVLAQLPEAFKRSALVSKALEQELSVKEVWKPTLQLANIAARQIESTGIPVTIIEKPLILAGFTNKDFNAWYNNHDASTNYRGLTLDKSSYVLEIMEGNGISTKNLTLEIRMKLIDPATGQVLGRDREWEIVDLPEFNQVLKDNGRIYKDIYLSTGRNLIRKSLAYLGLIRDE